MFPKHKIKEGPEALLIKTHMGEGDYKKIQPINAVRTKQQRSGIHISKALEFKMKRLLYMQTSHSLQLEDLILII